MAENFYTILTQVGLAKVANSQITSSKIDISKIAVGDGNGAYYDPASNATALKRKVWEGAVGSVEIDTNNPNWVVVETVIPSTVGGFTVREVGLYDVAGDLIAIGKYPETYKPVLAEGSSKDLYIRMIIEVANASAVTLKVDPAIIIASRKYVDDKVASSVGTIGQDVVGVQANLTAHASDGVKHITASERTSWNAKETVSGAQAKSDAVQASLTTHLADKANPHAVTKAQVGLSDVQNYGIASQLEAQAGVSNLKYMTPFLTNELLKMLIKTVTGTYVGNGGSGRVISLGFTPKLVFLFSKSGAQFEIYGDGGAFMITGSSIGNSMSESVVVDGFKVGPAYGNANSKTYNYVAFK